ncbi:MAG: hypothetical protein K940chlam1_00990 [Candidatus Anoxychlamydiales bacterium]|nr:hypothetical protein [Candidatus Anoxychlamydiales bacterium]NGX35966.1 hypothetical protein [Candidatus Anoxychlamydiales bacterium]
MKNKNIENYYLENLDLLSDRFPMLYLLMLSQREGDKNTKTSINLPLDDTFDEDEKIINALDTIFIYKCSLNIPFSKLDKWLQNKNKKLVFIEDNLDALEKFFQTKIANTFLKNEKVKIHFFEDIKALLQEVTPNTKTRQIDVLTFIKKDKKFQSLKEEILQDSLISFFANHDRIYSFKIFKNFYSNLDKLKGSFLVNKFKNKFRNKPAIIVGAGPSLNYSFDKLKKLQNQALIIAGGSAITCLSQQNILPHLGVIIDPNEEEYQRMKDSLAFEVPIVYSTRVNFGVFNTFNSPLGYIKAGIGGFFELFLENELKISGKHLVSERDEKALSVTTVSLMMAKLFGCNPIILDGVDLAYSENKQYALDIVDSNQIDTTREDISEKPKATLDKMSNKVFTNLKWEIEKDWISTFAKMSKKIKFINAAKTGLKIDNVKDLSYEKIEKKYLKNHFDYKAYLHSLIEQNKLKNAQKIDFIALKLKLKKSFQKCQNYLQDIVKNDPEYKAVLAKDEIRDEIAYRYFLIEADFTLSNFYQEDEIYDKLLELTNRFLDQFDI